jgi:release factor glutamine methyltransferase
LVLDARERLIHAGIRPELAALDAELLAREALGWDRARFLAERNDPAPGGFGARYEQAIGRRERREPVPYITGTREFWGLELEVCPDVLIPRPETELIVEEALERGRGRKRGSDPFLQGRPLIADIGTGSGCLAIALAREFPASRITATDISHPALAVARRNAARHGVADRISFVQTSYLSAIDGPFALIVSNPPYVPAVSAPGLTPEVREYEPGIAVFGGADGLEGLREVFSQAAPRLAPEGWLMVEFGYGQDEIVGQLIAEHPSLSLVKIREDLQGIPRTVVVRKTS